MSEATPSLLARLPGYDTAPDIYETPEPAAGDDTATASSAHRTSSESPTAFGTSATSDSESGSEDDESQSDGGRNTRGVVSRRRLRPERARDRFAAGVTRIEAGRVDLSDRVDGRRRGYKVRRRRGSREERVGESLDARFARLRRELEECRVAVDEQSQSEEALESTVKSEDVSELNKLLTSLETERTLPRTKIPKVSSNIPETGPGTDRNPDEAAVMGRVADFDVRLAALEQSLGLSALDAVTAEGSAGLPALSSPLLPSLTLIDQQMSALMAASSLASLDAMGTRIRRLRQEADRLSHATRTSTEEDSSELNEDEASAATLTPADRQSLLNLYTLIPTLQSLLPTVPALLARLQSLRTLHTSAAQASNTLDEVEQQQATLDSELQTWREGLDRVESAVREASEANGRNGKVVEGWVREVESRLRA